MNGNYKKCGSPTSGGHGPQCRNPVKGPWFCHMHGGPSAEEAERRVRERRAWLEQQIKDIEREISQEALIERVDNFDRKLASIENQLESEKSQREHNEQTTSSLKLDIQRLEQELETLQVERHKDELQTLRDETKIKWQKNRNRITELVAYIEPYLAVLKPIIDVVLSILGS